MDLQAFRNDKGKEEQENPLDYSCFQELYAAVEEAARL